ncbi:hypothetical protein HF520_10620 [Romboutsia sp. CE17]|uniref:hypothetical protein n=1 Tax=Romboutsia sp. CE17 TaxID=2724150 RepID=UPI001442A482|nr:hypothetical protein [Romboutsia sp. CE17]QJA09383.1 hypothetical protein HF520_10620 [Romboutsia sp. CE17]
MKYYKSNLEGLDKLREVLELSLRMISENIESNRKERKITWKKTSRISFDTKLFKIEEPELYEKYCRVSNNRLFKIK